MSNPFDEVSRQAAKAAGMTEGEARNVQHALRGQHEDDGSHHDFVGDRIEKYAEPGDGATRARNIAVEIVGHAHQAVDHEGNAIAQLPFRPPEEQRQQGHGDDPRKGQQVGQGQHRASAIAANLPGKKMRVPFTLRP